MLASLTVLLLAMGLVPAQSTSAPDLDTGELASGPYSRMHMLLEKTIFGVDILTLEIRVGERTRDRLRELAAGAPDSGRLAERVVRAVLGAEDVFVSLEFQRGVSFERWVEAVRESLEKAWKAGLIEQEPFQRVSRSLPDWFSAVAGRGFESGDRILYRGYPDRLRTVMVSAGGEIFVDQTDRGAIHKRTLLAGYLAPGTDFREPLVRSLLEP